MKISLSNCYKFTVCAALFGQTLVLLGLPLQIYALASLGVSLIVASSILAFACACCVNQKDRTTNNWIICICLLLFFSVLALLFSSSLNVNSIIKIVSFVEFPIFCMGARQAKQNSIRELIYGVNLCYPIMFAVFYNSGFSHRFIGEYGEIIHQNITLGYSNPNETGMYLMISLFILISALFHYKSATLRVFCVVEAMFMGYLLWETHCRAAILLTIMVLIITVFSKQFMIRKMVLNWILVFPVIFAVLLLMWPGAAEFTLWGDSLDTGRSILYRQAMQKMTFFRFLFGAYSQYGLSNMHNAYISVFSSLGVITSMVFWAVLRMVYKKCCNVILKKKENIALLLDTVAIVLHSAVETAFLVSGSAYAASAFLIYYLYVTNDELNQEGMS